jgi:hypothetical protein
MGLLKVPFLACCFTSMSREWIKPIVRYGQSA